MSKESINAVEIVPVEEEAILPAGESTWTEEVVIAGGNLIGFIQSLIHETSIRRITVRNSKGRVLLDVPAAVGLLAMFPPVLMYSLVALGFAVMAEYNVSIERVAQPNEASNEESIVVIDEPSKE